MSLWDSVKRFAQPYSDDEYDDYDEEDDYLDDEYEEERPARRSIGRRSAVAEAEPEIEEETEDDGFGFAAAAPASSAPAVGFSGKILGSTSAKQEVVLFRPGNFNETSKAADDLKNHKAVVLNLENVDKAMARRVVDFLSGTVYALEGSVKKIAQSAYIFCPHNMDVVGDLEALQAEVESYM